MNSSGTFSIFEASTDAYLFVWRARGYLLRIGLWLVAAKILTSSFIQFLRPEASWLESALWHLPTEVVTAWIVFLEMRLLLLGERADRLPADPQARRVRAAALNMTVTVSLLIHLGMAAGFMLLLTLTAKKDWNMSAAASLAFLFIAGSMIWALRFYILPVLAAVHAPFRPVLDRISGISFSFRLVGLGAVCLFPVIFLFQILLSLFWDKPVDIDMPIKLTTTEQAVLTVAGAFVSLAVTLLLNAALAYALKQMMGPKKDGDIA